MYDVIVTQHDASGDVLGVDIWQEQKLPDPQELGDKVYEEHGDCDYACVSVSVVGVCSPLYVIVIEGLHHNGAQN